MEFLGFWRNSADFSGIQQILEDFRRFSSNSVEFLMISTEFLKISTEFLRISSGIPCDSS
jgi:hypothetical protein